MKTSAKTIEPVRMKFSREMIRAFKDATRDTNDIHPPYVMGFQIDAVAEMVARQLLNNPELVYSGQEMRFNAPIMQDEEVNIVPQQIDRAIQVALYKGDIMAATGKVYFARPEELKEEGAEASGLEYVVSRDDVNLFHRGIGSEDDLLDPLFLVALSSNRALRSFDEQGFELPPEKMLVFTKHEIGVCKAATHIGYGDRLFLDVNNHNYKPGRPLFKVDLSATTPEGRKLYDVNFLLVVGDKAKLNL